jgi:hypothetical protein
MLINILILINNLYKYIQMLSCFRRLTETRLEPISGPLEEPKRMKVWVECGNRVKTKTISTENEQWLLLKSRIDVNVPDIVSFYLVGDILTPLYKNINKEQKFNQKYLGCS